MSPALRQVARSIAAAEAVQAREQLRAQLAEQRQAANRAMDYRTWLVVQAAQGNKAAESQLRGLAYQEQRNATQQGLQSAPELGAHADSGRPEAERAKRPAADPMATRSTLERDRPAAALRMTWEADTRAGTVDYYMDGQKAFTDRGSKVQFAKKDSGHDEIEAALRLGVQKFGKELDIKGSASFKMQAIEVAVMRGIDVQFSEKAMQARYEHLKAAHAAARVEAAQGGHVVPPRSQQPGEALQEAYQAVRDGDGKAQAAAAKNHPELAKAIALDRAAQAFAAERLQPEAREGFMRETRAKIEQDLRAGKPLSEIRKDLNRDRDAEQDHGL
ncbi:LPD7 domain-containing protein [Xanthomonas citri]|nr:LPD7 domain-containing protein [Xanthomonas citri]